jgi:hypothetical protein
MIKEFKKKYWLSLQNRDGLVINNMELIDLTNQSLEDIFNEYRDFLETKKYITVQLDHENKDYSKKQCFTRNGVAVDILINQFSVEEFKLNDRLKK